LEETERRLDSNNVLPRCIPDRDGRPAEKAFESYFQLCKKVLFVHSPLKRLVIIGARSKIARDLRRLASREGVASALFSRAGGGDISPIDDLFTRGVWTGGDTFVHAAWSTVPFTSEQNPAVEWLVDIPLLVRIIKFLGSLPLIERPHFCFLSSGGTVYGEASARPNIETDPLQPKGWHGLAKKEAEEITISLCCHLSVPYTILRISNPFGFPITNVKPQGIIQYALRAALEGIDLRVWGDGSAVKDFIFFEDLSVAMVALLRKRILGILNVASGESASVTQIIELTEKVAQKRINLVYEPPFEWDVQQSRLDITKLRSLTGWQPAVRLEDGILAAYKAMAGRQ
jgi:UDP-glucose 4-epimerase